MRARAASFALSTLLGVGLAAVAACHPRPSVYLLTVDTLRADHLGVYGYARATDPNLRRLASQSVVFTRAFTTKTKTTPAYASMLTGLYPYHHGLHALGQELVDEQDTLAEILAGHGYDTGGFVSSTVMVGRLSNFDQGFDVYDDVLPSEEANRANFQRVAARTVDAALAWLEANRRRTFLFLHLIDPHGPYTAPGAFAKMFRGGSAGAAKPVYGVDLRQRVPDDKYPAAQKLDGAETLQDYVDAYDGEVAYADAELGRLLDALAAAGRLEDSLVVFTADHGESLGEHGQFFRHGTNLYDETARVPLIVRPPGGRPSSVAPHWDGAVSVTDVFATVLDYAGIRRSAHLDGESLRPILESGDGDHERVVVSETGGATPIQWGLHSRDGSLLATRCDVVQSEAPGSGCLLAYFDAADDPGQLHSIYGGPAFDALKIRFGALQAAVAAVRLPFTVRRLYNPADKKFVTEFMDVHNRRPSALTPDDVRALKSLGYID